MTVYPITLTIQGVVPMNRIIEEDEDGVDGVDPASEDGYILGMMHNAAEQAEEFAMSIWHKLTKWKVIHFSSLPQWLQDNDFLHFGHRPPLPTSECLKSVMRIHTETGNIWTHLLGKYLFCHMISLSYLRPRVSFEDLSSFVCSGSSMMLM